MTYKDWDSPNWRDDTSMKYVSNYKKKFAWLPIRNKNNEKIWLKSYYSKYRTWSNTGFGEDDYMHIDFVENITTEEYIVRKLAETL